MAIHHRHSSYYINKRRIFQVNGKNIYGMGAPKSAGTSLWAWLRENTTYYVGTHDSIFTGPNQNHSINYQEAWTGGMFWLPKTMKAEDPSGLQVMTVRKDLAKWAMSFYTQFSGHPKESVQRVLALAPAIKEKDSNISMLGAKESVTTIDEEMDLLSRAVALSEWYCNKEPVRGVILNGFTGEYDVGANGKSQLTDCVKAYVEHMVEFARDSDSDPSNCLISIDGGTSTLIFTEWLLENGVNKRLFHGEAGINHAHQSSWPHRRKTPQHHFDQDLDEDIINGIKELCAPWEALYNKEVLSRILI
jgi:hypothetical protein